MAAEVISRCDAKRDGRLHYFTGCPCNHGHLEVRFVSNGACLACHRASIKKMRKARPDMELARKAKHRANNKHKIADYDRKKYEREKDAIIARVKKWQAANPDTVRSWNARRRAIIRRSEGSYTKADLRRIFRAQRGRCAYFHSCGSFLKKEYQADHIYPLSKGGNNSPSNIQLTCTECNLRKNSLMPEVFSRRIGMLV